MWSAAAAAGFAALGLFLGDFFCRALGLSNRVIGTILAFGSGMMIAVIAYSLVQESIDAAGSYWYTGTGLATGALAYFAGDALIARRYGGEESNPAGLSLALGALLDGVPESIVIGISAALGGSPSLAIVIGAFIANVPEGAAGGADLEESGMPRSRISLIWLAIAAAATVAALVGYQVIASFGGTTSAFFSGFAAGALLMVLADAMMPEAHERSGRSSGLFVLFGFAFGFVLAQLE